MQVRILFVLTASILVSQIGFVAADVSTPGNRPNIVLMMADDQGWGETGYNRHPSVKTPVLDEASRETLREL